MSLNYYFINQVLIPTAQPVSGLQPPTPDKCIVYGYYIDILGNGVENASVYFSLKRKGGQYKEAGGFIVEKPLVVKTDVNGYFQAILIRSSVYEGSGVYQISISENEEGLNTSNNITKKLDFEVPDLASVNITDLFTGK